ncbi:unnamed protein product [Arctogadus glacialis]
MDAEQRSPERRAGPPEEEKGGAERGRREGRRARREERAGRLATNHRPRPPVTHSPGELPQCMLGNRKVDDMIFMISCTNWY